MGIIFIPEPVRRPQRPTVPTEYYSPGTKWQSDDGSIWAIEWDNQDKRYAWFLESDAPFPADGEGTT